MDTQLPLPYYLFFYLTFSSTPKEEMIFILYEKQQVENK